MVNWVNPGKGSGWKRICNGQQSSEHPTKAFVLPSKRVPCWRNYQAHPDWHWNGSIFSLCVSERAAPENEWHLVCNHLLILCHFWLGWRASLLLSSFNASGNREHHAVTQLPHRRPHVPPPPNPPVLHDPARPPLPGLYDLFNSLCSPSRSRLSRDNHQVCKRISNTPPRELVCSDRIHPGQSI